MFVSKDALDVAQLLTLDSEQLVAVSHEQTVNSELFTQFLVHSDVTVEVLSALTVLSKQEWIRQSARQRLQKFGINSEQILAILQQANFTDSRKWAAEMLNDTDNLKQAHKIMQGRDKNTARLIQAKLDQIKQQSQLQQHREASQNQLLNAMEELSVSVYSPQYRGKYSLLVERWNVLDFEIDSGIAKRFERHRLDAETALQNYKKMDEAHQLQQQILQQLREFWAKLQSVALEQLKTLLTTLKLAEIESQWLQSLTEYSPEDNERESFHINYQRLGKVQQLVESIGAVEFNNHSDFQRLDSILSKVNLLEDMQSLTFVSALKTIHSQLSEKFRAEKQSDKELVKQLDKMFGIAFSIKKRGNFKPVHHHVKRIRAKIEQLNQPALTNKMQARVETLESDIKAADDWNKFALLPKFERLCSEMEVLIELSMPIPQKAQAIQKLQKQWKTLGYTDGTDELWRRFKTAGDKAFEPCAEYFAKDRKIRETNTIGLVKLCEALELLLQHEAIDGKALIEKVRLIDKAWHQKHDIDHKQIVDLRKRYKTVREKIEQRLENSYYQQIIEKRRGLIERLTRLAEGDISAHVEHQVQLLQSAWKQAESLPKKMDAPLWNDFKQQLDIFYQKRRDQNQQKRQQANQPLDQAKAIITELKQLLKDATDEKGFAKLQQQFNALSGLDGRKGSDFKKQFQQLSQKFEKQHQKTQRQSRYAELSELKRRAQLCRLLEQDASRQEEVEDQWEQYPFHNSSWLHQINQRKQRALQSGNDAVEINRHRQFCIDMEIALGVETPETDKTARMAMQMQLLKSKGLQGQKITDKLAYLQQKQIEWLTMSITHSEEFDELDKRFNQLLDLDYPRFRS